MRVASVVLVLLAVRVVSAGAEAPDLSEYYGFLPPEIYKFERRIGSLSLRDFDGDGTGDVVVANNARSRIDFLMSGGGDGGRSREVREGRGQANQVRSDQRMRPVSLPVNKELVSVQPGEFNGDGRLDLAYYGSPAELIILRNQGKGDFAELQRVRVPEAIESTNALAVGDLNGDGRDDLALLTDEEVVLVHQKAEGGLREPERLPHTAINPALMQIVDLDGDGVRDLLVLDGVPDNPLRLRRGTSDGQLGPEERLAIEPPRAIACADLDGAAGHEVLIIEAKSGRVKVLKLDASEGDGDGPKQGTGRALVYPLPREGEHGRAIAFGDLDGDGKPGVVATDPDNAQVLFFRQGAAGLTSARSFPSLANAKAIRVADSDGDGKHEVFILSDTEKQIAVSRLEKDRMTFPSALPTVGEPVALDVGDLNGDGRAEVLYAVSAGRSAGALDYTVRALSRAADGGFQPFNWGGSDRVDVKGLNGAPPALRVTDVNGDGHADILVFNDYGTPVLLVGRGDGAPTVFSGSMGPLVNATAATVGSPGTLGPGLLVAQSSYARAVALGTDQRWTIKDQFNAGRGDAQIVSAAVLRADGEPVVALVDRQARAVRFLHRQDGTFRPGEPLSLGTMAVQGASVADFNGDGREDLLLAGTDRFAIIETGRAAPKMKVLASYEPTREDAHLGDLLAGDANGDGKPEIVLTDTGEHFLEIVAYQTRPRPALDRALAFQVFESKSFRDPDRNVEPREFALADVDGDKRNDLVIVVHDRVLIYRQDPGPVVPDERAGAGP